MKKISLLVLTGILVLAFNIQEAHATGTYWHIEYVDTIGNVGSCTSLALDSNDNPHISYSDDTNGDLKYAWYDGNAWHIEPVDTTGDVGSSTSLALDSADNPHISYIDFTNADLKYARRDNNGIWHIEKVDDVLSGWIWETSLALDSGDTPHISYQGTTEKLKYAYKDGGWHTEIVDNSAGILGRRNSIALDSSGNPHIIYQDLANEQLKYACKNSSWYIEAVDTGGDWPDWPSIVVDSFDTPHISYENYPNGDLEYAYRSSGTWYIESVDTGGTVGLDTSIALEGDLPRIAYRDWTNKDLKYAYWHGTWSTETVDSGGDVGRWTSLAFDSNDIPHISYRGVTNGDLKYAVLKITYELTITPTTGGTTEPNVGIYTYVADSHVDVNAIPYECYEFDHWELDEEDVGSDNPYVVVMDSDHTLHAVFTQIEYDLTITTTGATTEPAPGTQSYLCGSYVDVNAIPDECYLFDHWELDGNDVGSDNPYSVLMDSNHTLEALFVQVEYDLTIAPTTGGTTEPSVGTYSYGCGSYVEGNAIPATFHLFDHWELDGNDVGSTNPYSVVMDCNHALHAVFAFAGNASSPSPADGAQDAATDVILSWAPGVDANLHDVYFSTDFNDVNDVNSSWPVASGPNDPNVYKGRQDANSFDPCGLELGKTYYWRIDEVNDPCIWKGNIWEFKVNRLVVDDMEDYNDINNPLWDTWLNGLYNLTGSWIELGTAPCEPVHGGKQSMIYDYNNSYNQGAGYYSEIEAATADLDVSSDWAGLGAKALTLYFYGDPNNDANDTEQMYVGLEDSNVAGSYGEVRYGDYGEDMNDIKIAKWQEWNIDLQDFNDAGVDLNDVNNVYIGFGDRDNQEVPGGVGVVYFDDIRLYIRRCLAEYQPEGDITGDCKVNPEDLEIMVDDWLELGDDNLADLYKDEDNIINLKDYAILANHWLEEVPLYPEE